MRCMLCRLVLLAVVATAACTTPEGECFKNQDCPTGELCNRDNTCVPLVVPPPTDAGRRDRIVGVDTFDAGPEDAAREDGPLDAAAHSDLARRDTTSPRDAAQPDTAPSQVDAMSVCQHPAALALSADQASLFVGCQGDDRIQVYGSIAGQLIRNLTSLATPCQPAALHLREDKSQLWVSCQANPQAKVLNVSPTTGLANQPAFTSSASPRARFASGSDRLVMVTVGSQSYSLMNIGLTFAVEVGAALILGGGGVAVRSDGSTIYFTQTSTTANNIYCIDQGNGPVACNLFTPFSVANLLTISPGSTSLPSTARNVLLVANAQSFIRLNQNGQVAPQVNIGQGQTRNMTVQPDGRFFYLGVFNTLTSASRVLQITSDTAVAVQAATEQSLSSCELTDLAAADDGRVFVSCTNNNTVQVLQF
ncbi:MAG: hypothetical protein ABIJ09_05775 [Pseudomonadota bacterium]